MVVYLLLLMFSIGVVKDARNISGRGRGAKILAAASLIISGWVVYRLVAGLVGGLCLIVFPWEVPIACALIGVVPGLASLWAAYLSGKKVFRKLSREPS